MDKNSERKMLAERIKRITDDLEKRIFVDTVDAGDFLFRDGEYKYEQLNEGEWTSFGKNDFWGYREQYCWFKQHITIPKEFAGKTVVYELKPFVYDSYRSRAFQFIAYANNRMVQAIDPNHTWFYLVDKAEGGEEYEVALSAYCDDWEFRGQAQLRAELKTIDKNVNDLYYDISVPWEVAHSYGPDDMPRIDILKKLNEACNMLELSTSDYDIFTASVKKAITYLHDNLYGEGLDDVVTSAIGHTHIDTAWLWRLRQTRQKAGRSFATVINLMKEFPDYKFMSPQAQLYDFVKQDYPELYADIKKMIRDSRWEVEGSMWVESDTNVISGESLVRQFLVGKRFFRDEFDEDTKIMWLPDVFGYSAALPQIMKLAGIDYFMTTKISWSEYNRFPFDTFKWRGIDGTEILSHFIPSQGCNSNGFTTTYNAYLSPNDIIGGWRRYSNKDLNRNVLCSYGHGDGGGGPTRGMIENGLRMAEGIPGCPKVKMEFSRKFFDRLANEVEGNPRLPIWSGELYLEYHRGTYTAQARNKRYNRKSEFLYQDIETLAETANILSECCYPSEKLLEGWKIILLNQFHDIIPGSSIAAVYEDSKQQYEEIGAAGREMAHTALKEIASKATTKGDSFVVENTLGFKRSEVVITDLPFDNVCIYDSHGDLVPSQKTYDGKLAFFAKNIPSKGFKVFKIEKGTEQVQTDYCVTDTSAENDYYKLTFDENMNISSLYHKESGRYTAPDGELLNRLIAYEDRSHNHEAWDIKCYYDEKSWIIDNAEHCSIVESGPVRTVKLITRKFNNSVINQYYIFYPNTARIDILYDVDWKEKNVALKADYPVDVNAVNATFDIQFGNIQRTAHNNTTWDFAQFEVCGHKWADLSDNGFGLSVLNDCKYGWTVKDGHIRPTLLRSATTPNHLQDRERHAFTYAIYPHSGPVCTSDVVNEAYSLNVPLYCIREEEKHNGIGKKFSLVKCDKSNVIIETLKKAEDSDGIVIRTYETWNKKTICKFDLGIDAKEIYECNLLEENDVLVAKGNSFTAEYKPFEIKTFKVIL